MGIHFRQVSHQYFSQQNSDYQAIYDITLSIEDQHEFICLIGHTGSGKSTLAQHMNALVFPTKGTVEIAGVLVSQKRDKKTDYNRLRKHVGLVFQFPEYQLFEETVEKDIMFGPLNFKVSPEVAKEKALESIRLVGLNESYLNRNPFNLSGGEKKRVSIAGILAMDPEILVLDEPTSGLDPQGKRQLMRLFKDIQEKTNKTVVIITHDMDLVYEYATRTLVLSDGNLVFDGTPDDLFRREELATWSLSLPQTIRVLKGLKEQFHLELNPYQKTVEEAVREIEKVTSR
ncbi:MAG: energy-coupling factor transporter ATPase [Candidatus Izemoplasmatales bacterium]|nr:energy-coupling factor transporter ATPase [Candidatus Izemoplasmatales bacterium]